MIGAADAGGALPRHDSSRAPQPLGVLVRALDVCRRIWGVRNCNLASELGDFTAAI